MDVESFCPRYVSDSVAGIGDGCPYRFSFVYRITWPRLCGKEVNTRSAINTIEIRVKSLLQGNNNGEAI